MTDRRENHAEGGRTALSGETTAPAGRPAWLNGVAWRRAGYVATGLWFLFVLAATAEPGPHPLRDVIFIVPLAGWVLGLLIGAWLKRRHAARGGAKGAVR